MHKTGQFVSAAVQTAQTGTLWDVLLTMIRLGVAAKHNEASEREGRISESLQSSEGTHVKRCSQFWRGARVGGECGGWGGRIRRGGCR